MKLKIAFASALFVCLLWAAPADIHAQCAMCKGAAETALKQGGGDPKGLNNGILYMLALPYLLVGSIGLWWYKNRKKEQAEDLTEEDTILGQP